METLKYTLVKSKEQYDKYCIILENLIERDNSIFQDEIELLTFLIEKWDEEHNSFKDLDPVELIKALMTEHYLKANDLIDILGLTKGTVSKILNCHKGLSKDSIRKLSDYFKVTQEAFNRPYQLISDTDRHFRNASLMKYKKNVIGV